MINLWNNYQSGTKENKPDFHVVIEQLEKFLEPIFHAVIEEKEWFYTWDLSLIHIYDNAFFFIMSPPFMKYHRPCICIVTVSYTHLDVYKRQDYRRRPCRSDRGL